MDMIFGENGSQSNPGQPQKQQVRLDASQIDTVYANSFAVTSSPEEIALYLGVNTPLPGMNQPVVKLTHRLILNPQNAKRLMQVMQHTVKAHEDRFGPIELPPPPQGGPNR